MSTEYWSRGQQIPVRHVRGGKVRVAAPAIVVEDGPERLIIYTPMGSRMQRSRIDFASGEMHAVEPYVWHTTSVLRILEPQVGFGISAMFWGQTGAFACWYVDLQDPVRRAGGGILTWDHLLDIVVAPDLKWQWKDEDQFARIQELGWLSPERALAIRKDGMAVIERIERRERPFNENWPNWRPDKSWPIPSLPDDWAVVPE